MNDPLPIPPIDPFDVTLRPPGSKSLTNRALAMAALADGESELEGVLLAGDTRLMIEGLRQLGFTLDVDESSAAVRVTGQGGRIPTQRAKLMLGNAGAAFRFLTALCCLGVGDYRLDGSSRMHDRPVGPLVDALRELGAKVDYLKADGYPPLRLQPTGLEGGPLILRPSVSSQFISALLIASPGMALGLEIAIDGPMPSRPYVEMTVEAMRAFGAPVRVTEDWRGITVPRSGRYTAADYPIEPDASNASYFLAAAAILPGSRCRMEGLGRNSIQGDVKFADLLEEMGADVTVEDEAITVIGREGLHGIDVDLNEMPDLAMTLAAAALFAEGPTAIRNIGNLRVKETDRLAALSVELARLGAAVTVDGDDLLIAGGAAGRLRPTDVITYDDHRMAMSFAVVGLRQKGVRLHDPGCVAKTFPDFFEYLERLRQSSSP